ncbi:uncharacterized protein PHACADRAFT_106717 [Phanerochaete carnosa HHB-10118-sp]|uniref:Tyrosine-protein kinase ephrin type A/B receptor-like domain-containing protein n=1 Tax=Phanerochaete carnosa (strain HHB-10118-sp) TaxID=650164 RepID=K5WHL5_PHACS|nr:uncharacterized protein PHACADRAFT_106717 [Phanerochaete carnosa HHB-10118-sp]EKM49722.1 hypothetical protein PHACADRAFT_106717 [Phanerochaete carnosa HHB-10118-sp]
MVSESNAAACKDAQPGYFATGPGATSETTCSPGYYSTGLAAQCTICPAGTHCNGSGNTRPQACEPGRFSASPGASQDCSLCRAGTFSNVTGATSCCSCCSGWYNDQAGQTHCFSCPNRGSFQQGWSPIGAISASDCTAAVGAMHSCNHDGDKCPRTGGSSPSSGAYKRSPPQRKQTLKCPSGHKKCPVYGMIYGAGYTRSYECVDTQNDLESCGGCVDGDSWNGEPSAAGGRDCSAIPNVDSVRCAKGQCIIGELLYVGEGAVSDDPCPQNSVNGDTRSLATA